jgi:hypothetical protein
MKLSQSDKLLKIIHREIESRSMLMEVSGAREFEYLRGCIDMLKFIREIILVTNQELK